jgi:DNA-binding MarR family transcriptional regulator
VGEEAPGGGQPATSHPALCLWLMQMFPRVSRGMRRWQDQAAPASSASLGPRHVAALQQLRDGPVSVGELAGRLGLTLPTVSGVVADLDKAGFVGRHPDPADRRRTIVAVVPEQQAVIEGWLNGASGPLERVLGKLKPSEREAFVKAMDLLEAELTAGPIPSCAEPQPDRHGQ